MPATPAATSDPTASAPAAAASAQARSEHDGAAERDPGQHEHGAVAGHDATQVGGDLARTSPSTPAEPGRQPPRARSPGDGGVQRATDDTGSTIHHSTTLTTPGAHERAGQHDHGPPAVAASPARAARAADPTITSAATDGRERAEPAGGPADRIERVDDRPDRPAGVLGERRHDVERPAAVVGAGPQPVGRRQRRAR